MAIKEGRKKGEREGKKERRVYLTRDMHGDKVTVLGNFLNHFLTIESVSVIFHVKGESKSLRAFGRYFES